MRSHGQYVERLLAGNGWPKLGHYEFLGGDGGRLGFGFCVSEKSRAESPECTYVCTHGAIPTALGWVVFYAQTAGAGCRHDYPPYTRMEIILNGRALTKRVDRYCAPRYVVTLARRWVKDLEGGY